MRFLLFIVSNDYFFSTYNMQLGIFIQSSLMSNPGLSYLTKEDIIQFSASAGTAVAPTSKSLRCGFRLLMYFPWYKSLNTPTIRDVYVLFSRGDFLSQFGADVAKTARLLAFVDAQIQRQEQDMHALAVKSGGGGGGAVPALATNFTMAAAEHMTEW